MWHLPSFFLQPVPKNRLLVALYSIVFSESKYMVQTDWKRTAIMETSERERVNRQELCILSLNYGMPLYKSLKLLCFLVLLLIKWECRLNCSFSPKLANCSVAVIIVIFIISSSSQLSVWFFCWSEILFSKKCPNIQLSEHLTCMDGCNYHSDRSRDF